MGQSESSFKRTYEETVAQLSTLQLGEITGRFNEVYAKAGGPKGHLVDRDAFSKYFNLPVAVGDRLFDSFDEKKNGKVSFEEFVCGLAVVLHGSFHDRCFLLFRVFNLGGDEGISRSELTTMLTAILQSTDTILYTVCESDGAVMGGQGRQEAVKLMVDRAFSNCDITGTGKLLPVEFEYWLKRNPKVLDSLLSFNTRDEECTVGQLIMSPSEQQLGHGSSEEQARGSNVEQIRGSNVEQVRESNEEQVRGSNEEQVRGSNVEEVRESNEEQVRGSNEEQVEPSSPVLFTTYEHSQETKDQSSIALGCDLPNDVEEVDCAYPDEDENLSSAWILSPLTMEVLSQSQSTRQKEHLTCPALVADITFSDPINDLLTVHFPEAKRKPLLSVDNVSMDVDGLRKLVMSGCFHSALELTSRFLSAHGQGLGQAGQPTLHTYKTLQMWSARFSLLTHLGLYREAESELTAFGELTNPDLYYQYHSHSYPNRKGSIVPFTMRLLHALIPSLIGNYQSSLDRLCTLKCVCTKIMDELSIGRLPGVSMSIDTNDQKVGLQLWKNRLVCTTYCLGNVLVSLADYLPAFRIYESIIDLCPSQAPLIYSGIGRLCLNLGDLQTAQKYFSKVDYHKSLILFNEGLVNVFLSRWQAVKECLLAALTEDPGNNVIQANLAVCTFYLGRLKESIEGMEGLLTVNPPSSLQPAVCANLAAAYELESGHSMEKKLNFLPLLGGHVCEGSQLQALNIR